MTQEKLTVLDLFSGIGGFSLLDSMKARKSHEKEIFS
jgi:hypothetical protein